MSLPTFKDVSLTFSLLQSAWKQHIDPLLSNPMNNITILPGIVLASGANVINHHLGRKPQGWVVTDVNTSVTIYRSQPFDDKTLTLTSSGAATVSIGVF